MRGGGGHAPEPGTDASAAGARDVVVDLIARPPSNLAELERLVGRLEVDMAGPEGRGAGVFRPESPFDPVGEGGRPRRGHLHDGIVRAFLLFDYDPYHGHPRTLDGLRPNEVMVSVDLDRGEVLRYLEQAFGAPRSIEREGGVTLEAGAWYYLERWERPSALSWHARRPDWAVPPVSAQAAEAFVTALVAALGDGAEAASSPPGLEPLAVAAGARVTWSASQVSVTARPGLPLPVVASALGWIGAVAWSPDVHMASWQAGPPDPTRGHPTRTALGRWQVEVWLDGSPRDAPQLGFAGPSALYDVWGRPVPVRGIRGEAGEPLGHEADRLDHRAELRLHLGR